MKYVTYKLQLTTIKVKKEKYMKQLLLGTLALSFLMIGCNVDEGKTKKETTEKKTETEETTKPSKGDE